MNPVGRRLAWTALILAVGACSQPSNEPTTTISIPDTTDTPQTTVPRSTTTQPSDTTTTSEVSPSGLLVFHKTEGFRHDSIDAGIDALNELADSAGYTTTVTEDASVFSSAGLKSFDVIVFLNTTGDVLDDGQQRAMEEFIQAGKGFVGIHSATDTEYDWEWYGGLVGTYFDSHPDPQSASVEFTSTHPVAADLPQGVERFDEWYNFRSQPGPEVSVLAFLDESTYEGGRMGESHPIVWAQEYDGGRSVYIGFGHTPESFGEPLVRTLLGNAIEWAAGR